MAFPQDMAGAQTLAAIAGDVLMFGGIYMSFDSAYSTLWPFFAAFGLGMVSCSVLVQVLTWRIYRKRRRTMAVRE
jgi:hypothetical protein